MIWAEVLIYNIVFWSVYGYICAIPEILMNQVMKENE
jgi:hypothetical protein